MCNKFTKISLLPLLTTRIRRAPTGLVGLPIDTFSKRLLNNAGQHFGNGFVKQMALP